VLHLFLAHIAVGNCADLQRDWCLQQFCVLAYDDVHLLDDWNRFIRGWWWSDGCGCSRNLKLCELSEPVSDGLRKKLSFIKRHLVMV